VWSSSAGCGDAQAFSSELKSRTALLRDADRDEHAITFIVETFREADRVHGQLTVRKPDGELSVREVPGASCEEVESAMTLIAALMVDPLAAGLTTERQPTRKVDKATSSSLASSAPPGWSLRIEHRLIAQGAVAPGLAWGQAGRLLVTRESRGWRPAFGLSAHFTEATSVAVQGSAELEWAAVQGSLCPLGVEFRGGWDLRGCAVIQLGSLRGSGFRTESAATKSILWSSAGAQLEARFQLWEPLWVGWEGSLTFPFTRERFYLQSGETLHRVPAWGVSSGVGLGLRFF
jgi:hypothetical protein